LARENLKVRPVGYLIEIIKTVKQKDPAVAAGFADDVIARLLAWDFFYPKPEANLAEALLRWLADETKNTENFWLKLDRANLRLLAIKVSGLYLKESALATRYNQLPGLFPLIEKVAPEEVAKLQVKVDEDSARQKLYVGPTDEDKRLQALPPETLFTEA